MSTAWRVQATTSGVTPWQGRAGISIIEIDPVPRRRLIAIEVVRVPSWRGRMRRWLMRAAVRAGDPQSGSHATGVQGAYEGLSVAARSGSVEVQDEAWEELRAAASSANAGSVLIAMELVEESHHDGPLTHQQAVRRLTEAVYGSPTDW